MTALDLLTGHPFVQGIPEPQLARLSRWGRRTTFRAGARVFDEGQPARRFWLIREGHVQLDAYLPGRGPQVVESIGAGTVLGWSWLFTPHVWHFGATAAEPTLAIEFDGAGVRRLCEEDPAFGLDLTRRFGQVVVDRLQATRLRLLDLYAAP
jgi:CRP-like cAMP-binding protein